MRTVLAAVDATEMAKLVVTRAAEIARSRGAKVRLVRALPAPNEGTPLGGLDAPARLERDIAAAKASLEPLVALLPEEVRGGVAIDVGTPAEIVCRAAQTSRAELVVIGAHEHGRVARLLGTTAARIVNEIDRPVLVVRPLPDEVLRDEGAGERLRQEHARLDGVFEELLRSYRSDDWSEVRVRWNDFETALRAHMQLEEEHVLPAFAAEHPDEARAVVNEHDALRAALDGFGVHVELHTFNLAEAEALVARVREHAAHEERTFYPWTESKAGRR